ncbi:SDR family oxidoreductase [Alphaproteobacteria bacterium]|nr:SDR family oxidoreductase [Alphaproteobacteria bacterium]
MKNVIITGAGGVLGKSHIKKLIEKKWKVFATEINNDRLEQLNEKFEHTGLFKVILADNRVEKEVTLIYDEAEKFFNNQINVLINNAGFTMEMILKSKSKFPDFTEMPLDFWEKILNANLTSCFLSCREFVRRYKENIDTSNIVNIATMYALRAPHFSAYNNEPFHCLSAYSASKAGVHGLTLWLSSYLREKKIRVNTLAPGAVYNGHSENFQKQISELTLTGRMANPEEISSTLAFLCSDDASYINGQIIFCDGGYGSW